MSSNRSTTELAGHSGGDDPGPAASPGTARRWTLFLTGALVGAVFLYFAVRNIDLDEVLQALAGIQVRWLIPLTAVYLCNLGLRVWRWQLMFPPESRPSTRHTADVFFIGKLGNNIMPGRLGEVLRAAAFGKLFPQIGFSGAFTTIVLEKTLDAIGVAMLFGVALLIAPLPQWALNAGLGLAILCPVVLMAMLAVDRVRTVFGDRLEAPTARSFTERVFSKLKGILAKYSLGLHILRSKRRFTVLSSMTLLIWLVEIVVVYLCLLIFDIDAPAAAALVTVVLLCIGSMLPAAPGFIGTYQLFIVAALALYGVPDSSAFALAVFLNLFVVLLTTVIGVIALVSEGGALEFGKLLDSVKVRT